VWTSAEIRARSAHDGFDLAAAGIHTDETAGDLRAEHAAVDRADDRGR
jgi:hypothetical protein